MTSRHSIRGFLGDSRGNVLMITGLAAILLIVAAGMGIDLGRQQLVRIRMQQSSDAAALAARLAPTGTDKHQVANRYFNLNFTPSYMGFDRPIPVIDIGNNITVSTHGSLPTSLMANGGVKDMAVGGRSVVGADTVNTAQSYDIILVMDNSFSMAINKDVNATRIMEADPGTPCRPWVYYTGQACPSDGTGASRINALRYSVVQLANTLLNPNQAHSRIGSITWSSTAGEIQSAPLSEDYNTVRTFLGRMIGFEATDSATGMAAAQGMANDFRPDSVRAIVLLTDGFNTFAGTPHVNSDGTVSDQYGCDGNNYCPQAYVTTPPICNSFKDHGVLVYTIAFGQDVISPSPHAAEIQSFLSACASGTAGSNQNQYFFIAPDADTLNKAFSSILTSIGNVRIKE